MTKYKYGIYRKKVKERLGRFVYLRESTQPHYDYELLTKKEFKNQFFKMLYEAKGEVPYIIELFNYSWYKKDFHNKYQFIKEGTIEECDHLEKERLNQLKEERYARRKSRTN